VPRSVDPSRPRARRRAPRSPRRPLLALPLLLLLPFLPGGWSGRPQQAPEYDLIIRNGRLLDGTGTPWYRADVAVRGDRIAAVGDLRGARAVRVIEAADRYVAPGFIDMHTHAGEGLALADRADARALLAQGITTVVINPDGGGPIDLDRQRATLEAHGIGVNAAPLIGHGSIRSAVIGEEDRPATPSELERMRRLVRQGMEAGAFGLSSGPYYVPGAFSDTEELAAVAEVAAGFDGVHQSHIRDESDYSIGLPAAVEELIEVSRRTGVRGIVTHIKALGPGVWGQSAEVVARIEAARAEGVPVWADQYPYEASSTSLAAALLPRWAEAGGRAALVARFDDPTVAGRLREEMEANLARRGGADRIVLRTTGRTLAETAAAEGTDAVTAAIAILRQGSPAIISFNMDEGDIRTFMVQPWTMTSSDGELPRFGGGLPHPRAYGAFPRKIRKYVLEQGVLTLEQAVHSMTGLSATVMGIPERGEVRTGYFADLLIFDPARVRDTATYEQPHAYAEGMDYVVVNGRFAIDGGVFADVRAGRVLRKTAR
jgi:N-acyl-D-amino-acid deacylase